MKNKFMNLGWGLIVGAAMLMVSLLPMANWQAQAAPPAAPTPVAAPDSVQDGNFFRFQPATAITADTNTSAVEVMSFQTVDIEYTIDHGTVNTTTLTVQYSNHGEASGNWTDGAVLVSNSAADGTVLTARVPVYGRYMRINQNVTTADTITITLTAVGR